MKIGVLGSTRGSSLQPVIDAIANDQLDASINVILTNREDAGILGRAQEHNIPGYYIEATSRKAFEEKATSLLKHYEVELVLLVGYMRVLSPVFVQAWADHIINVHPSLLPKHAGKLDLDVHRSVLESGDKTTGCTVHFVDEGVDTGPVLLQKECVVADGDTPERLKAKVQVLESAALIEAINLISVER
ncbi:MAG: phosphoribosylglycinamide formyltransferase [Gammaproteobacteria bacterium]